MSTASCHCGGGTIAPPVPTQVTSCNCTVCRRYGAIWAYYHPSQVTLPPAGATDTYIWGAKSQAFHRCKTCGCVTHWKSFAPNDDTLGVNARLMDPAQNRAREILAAWTAERN